MRLFLYGTLMAGSGNPFAADLHRLLGPGVAATVRGQLYAIADAQGWYPGLIPDPAGGPVHGFVHEATDRFGSSELAALDRYEEYDPEAANASEFVRRPIDVFTQSGAVSAQAYALQALPETGFVPILDGSFARFLQDTGYRPYGAPDPEQP